MKKEMKCRICEGETEEVLDLGEMPPANSLLPQDSKIKLSNYPLVLDYCDNCKNLQLRECLNEKELYENYLYVTPNSPSLKTHYSKLIEFMRKNDYISNKTRLLEIGSNSGEFLKEIKSSVLSILGIDPAKKISEKANSEGIETINDFFGQRSLKKLKKYNDKYDLIIGRHCMAHNCDVRSLISTVFEIMDDNGVLVIENAYAANTINNVEYDQIYHEHMFYFSISSIENLLKINNMRLINCMTSSVHGGSIVFFAVKEQSKHKEVDELKNYKYKEGLVLSKESVYHFASRAKTNSIKLKKLIDKIKADGKSIYCYGASAKGSTLLNHANITSNEIDYCIDNTPEKQNKLMAGCNIPIKDEDFLMENPPDFILLTAWNYKDELVRKYRNNSSATTIFIVPIPDINLI